MSSPCSPPSSSSPPTSNDPHSLLSILESLHAHLTHQTSLLPPLIHRLGLPPSTLTSELEALQASLVSSVDASIDARRTQVSEWEEKCEGVEERCERLTRALGKESKKRLEEVRCEEVLPRRYELSCEYQEKLRQMYHAKLEQLTNVSNRILLLSKSLSTNFYGEDVINHTLAPGEDANDDDAHRDVTPERFARLEKELVRGKVEVNKRLNELATLFGQLDWMYSELGISPPHPDGDDEDEDDPFNSPTPSRPSSSSTATHFQTRTQARLSEEEQYQLVFHTYLKTVASSVSSTPSSSSPLEENPLLGVQGVDPTQSLVNWASDMLTALGTLKAQREARIQALYDALEPLWRRMGVPETSIDAFVDHHRGSTEETLREYEAELERMQELRRESLGEFILSAREEIRLLWSELMYPEDEERGYAPFEDDENTEELLSIHEDEVRRLKEEKRVKGGLLASVKKYFDVLEEEKELIRAASDQTRLLGRGGGAGGKEKRDPGRLLREEKMRKRVAKEKPRLEQDLLASLPVWESETGCDFLVYGESMLKLLHESVSERESVATTRSKSRAGSVPPPHRDAPPQTRSNTNGNGKRGTSVDPSAGAGGGGGPPNKRQKLAQSQPSRPPSTVQRTSTTRVPSSTGGHRGHGHSVGGGSQKRVVSGLPRLSPKKPPTGSLGMSGLGHGRLPNGHPFARQKRESFKPRPSTDLAPPLAGFGARMGMKSSTAVKEEDEG